MLWASAELWRTTHEAKYETYFLAHEGQFRETLRPTGPPSWPTVAPLALCAYALDRAAGEAAAAIRTQSTAAADAIVARTAAHAYRVSMGRVRRVRRVRTSH
jgi:endoglucanase